MDGGKNRIQPTTVACNTTALPEVKMGEVSSSVPLHLHAHLLLHVRLYLPAQLFLPVQHTTERSTTWNIERIVVPSTGTLVREVHPSVREDLLEGTSCNGTSSEFLLTLGLGSTGMLCFTAIALGYL
ncbi:hypothetical protein RvY_16864 [Ramazzottius varieornatus]|uniref:Uncharacterized protein n=1 Tax=Ramazzottius varieornatus TaxID=947166 RepID=A0A1D1W482_RAMVA|nr:hypothetical protein RvY_16864 [Ramazzottius varieornatus]